jgi:hypothetical protein
MAKKSKKSTRKLNPQKELKVKKEKNSESLQKLEIKNKNNYVIKFDDLNSASYLYKEKISADKINKLFDNYKVMGLINEKYLPLLGIYSLEIKIDNVEILIQPYRIFSKYDNEILNKYNSSNIIKIDNDKKDLVRISMLEDLSKLRAPIDTGCTINFVGEIQKIIPYINELEKVLHN